VKEVKPEIKTPDIESINKLLSENRIFGFCKKRDERFPEYREANPLQWNLLEAWKDKSKKIFTFTGGNRMGKTFIDTYLALCTVFGEWPHNGEKIIFPHDKPRKVRIVGQGWETHIKTVIEPYLKFWWPKSRPVEIKKNNQGIQAFWKDLRTKSTLEVMSNVQESSTFEGWEGDLVVYDEPPKRDVRVACARGLIDRLGRELFAMTLVKEAWVHRDVIKAVNHDGTPDMSVFNVTGQIYSNLGYGLTMEGINQFAKALTEDEKQARLLGVPSYMTSLIWPLNRDIHIKERFSIPMDWIVDVEIDFHPSKPWAVLFVATDPRNMKWCIKELWEHGNPKYISEVIMKYILENKLRVNRIEIDPLAKGDGNNDETVFEIMRRYFMSYGYSLHPASKDKDNGIAIIKNLLMTDNQMPALFFFKDLKKTINHVENWMTDPDTLKPSKDDDDFCECLYRIGLLNTQWFEPYEIEERPMRVARSAYTGY